MENHLQYLPELSEPFLMVAVDGGRFDMGGGSWNNESSLPVHPVEVDDFWMSEYLVTKTLWNAVRGVGNNLSYFKGFNRPVEMVSWDVIDQEFLPRLNKKTEYSRPLGTVYRLPTEAEWEYAARGGRDWETHPFSYAGSNVLDEVGWYNENSSNETKSVGLKLPNLLGLHDMIGNVWEWCADWYDTDYYQECLEKGVIKNPKGPDKGWSRILRGNCWYDPKRICHSAYRFSDTPATRGYEIGFRLVLSGPS
jgi:formylglycine-generating enzyme required for sulfatase activity